MDNESATFEALQLCVVINEDGDTQYYNNENQLHRIYGPAIIFATGTKYWYLNDKLHRKDGPAIEYAFGCKEWWVNDMLHRDDGPAIEWSDGSKEWYLNDKKLTKSKFLKHPLCTIK